ncbi:hypothetical protein ONS95_002373 [Cadophora gregata]|uniref:uncharacterized protein n=1 Tax=Cadophora gregata TaxID=51156 RepID=UPI0026DAD65F|nr:uncharacterized protein ONS95_002373 [Cadophora gregata]KAK0109694.1 hypothetical protein ONS95_002373 [Cadophora gregata]KAK0110674.1 hypothetical protein ONS96_002276 [Cadophora gregata f. sp. sojae]
MASSRIRKKYLQFPKTVFGLRCSQHRAKKMCHVFRYYKGRGHSGATKEKLLEILVELEDELPNQEVEIVKSWLEADRSVGALGDQLDVARGRYPGAECCVCTDSFPQHRFPNVTSTCDHGPTVCEDCIKQSVNTQIMQVAWDKIKCPECSEALQYDVVKKWASKKSFEKYDENSAKSAMTELTMCLGANCGSGQIHDGGDAQPIMTCNECGFKTCYTHKMPWHSGQTCRQYEIDRKERMEQEAASEKFIREKLAAKTCADPSCGARIQKRGGCDHMSYVVMSSAMCAWLLGRESYSRETQLILRVASITPTIFRTFVTSQRKKPMTTKFSNRTLKCKGRALFCVYY